ncbi:MAG TPA: hypothetical protein VHZ55_33530, partial [Bryobacteraceae bacterium]|nr:hypothetical protein [Bryobacteraceae bacterium]
QDLQVLVPRLASGAEVTTSTSLPDWLNKKFNGVRSQILPLLESALRPHDIPAGLVVVAKDVTDQFRMGSELLTSERSFVLVQGAESLRSRVDTATLELNPLTASAY